MAKKNPILTNPIGGIKPIKKIDVELGKINSDLANTGWDNTSVSSSLSLSGTFFIKKTTFNNQIFRAFLDDNIFGIWIWLIKEVGATKIIVSRAERAITPYIIPEAALNYQIYSNSEDFRGLFSTSFDLPWKENKKNEGHFSDVKGFFISRGLLNRALSATSTLGIQIKVWQDTDHLPSLSFNRINTGNATEHLGAAITSQIQPIGGGSTRPSPPYGGE